jgi:hypothetical protein
MLVAYILMFIKTACYAFVTKNKGDSYELI